jgi:hypothetical protein
MRENAETAVFWGPNQVCPSAWTLSLLSEGSLDESSAPKVRLHVIACEECFETYLLLMDMKRIQEKDETVH